MLKVLSLGHVTRTLSLDGICLRLRTQLQATHRIVILFTLFITGQRDYGSAEILLLRGPLGQLEATNKKSPGMDPRFPQVLLHQRWECKAQSRATKALTARHLSTQKISRPPY